MSHAEKDAEGMNILRAELAALKLRYSKAEQDVISLLGSAMLTKSIIEAFHIDRMIDGKHKEELGICHICGCHQQLDRAIAKVLHKCQM